MEGEPFERRLSRADMLRLAALAAERESWPGRLRRPTPRSRG